MQKISATPPGQLQKISRFEEDILDSSAFNFSISQHNYVLRFDRLNLDSPGYARIADDFPDHLDHRSSFYLIKFDNIQNIMNRTDYRRIEKSALLSPKQFLDLTGFVIGGIAQFCQSMSPDILCGQPNDAKLLWWYKKVISQTPISGYNWRITSSPYATELGVVLLYRVL